MFTKKCSYGYKYMKIVRRKYPDCLADSCKRSSVNRMAAGSKLSMDFSSFSYFSNILSAVTNILGLSKAFWYTGSAFTRHFNHDDCTLREQYSPSTIIS